MKLDDIRRLTKSSMDFDQAAALCPILTVCEKQETKIRHGLTSKKFMLVDMKFAMTGNKDETSIELDVNHKHLCNVSNNTDALEFIESGDEAVSAKDQWSEIDPNELQTGRNAYDSGESTSNPTSGGDLFTPLATVGTSDLGFETIPPVSEDKVARGIPALPVYSIPVVRNRDFCGRSEIFERLDDFFLSKQQEDGNGSKSFAICGQGGIGKTQVAAEYAHRCRERNLFDAIFWVLADEPSKLADGLGRISMDLGLIDEDSIDARDQVITGNLTKGWLSNPVKDSDINDEEVDKQATWLLVIDNMDDVKILDDFWPLDGPGCILITSRDPLAKDSTVLARSGIDLEPLNSREASQMLEKLTNKKGDSDAVGERLGGLPLAIAQMASIIVRNHFTFAEFVEAWDEKETHKELLGLDERRMSVDLYGKSLSTVWAIEDLRHGRALLDTLAFLDPDSIQERLLRTSQLLPLEKYPASFSRYHKSRTELLQTSLITRDSTEQKIAVHRLVQTVAISKMNPPHLTKAYSTALHLVFSAWPFEAFGWRHDVARWRRCEDLFPHVLRLKHLGIDQMESHMAQDSNLEYCKLMNDAGWYHHETGHSVDSMPLIEAARSAALSLQSSIQVEVLGSDSSLVTKQLDSVIAEAHHNLGCIGTETNNPEFTLTHFKRFNQLMRGEIDDSKQREDARLAISWNELGNAYMMNKMWPEGERCFKQCLETARLLKDYNPAEFSFPFVNLGLAYWITGRFNDAAETMLKGLRYREAAYGRDDRQSFITGRFLFGLGNVKASQGKLDESFVYHQRALRQFLSTIGKNHHRTGDVHVRMADHHARLEQFGVARDHIDEALRIFQDRVVYQPEKARALFRKSEILRGQGHLQEAHESQKESLRLYHDILSAAPKTSEGLSHADYDDLVAFWSR
ncbi:MAG: hypothetical protein M1822_000812 [Bathelium mastoideum]|nr:MAG: hypothetical protein M1822_000812 [Bathelium mastoideum]